MSQQLRAELAAFHADDTGMANPTILTVGEARGHGFYIDEKSLDQAARILVGKSLKSYLNHDTAAATKRTGQEIGFLTRFYREGQRLRAAAFEYFDSFKRQAAELHERLVELTTKIPDALGFSPVISFSPVWVMKDGTEIPAELKQKAPPGAIRDIPSARILDILSADIVGKPAVNLTGFLAAGEPPLVDAKDNKQANTKTMSTSITFDQAALDAKLAEQKQALTAELEAKHTAALAEQAKANEAALAAVNTKVAELEAKIAEKDKAHTAALEAMAKSHADAIAKLEADHAAKLKEAEGFDARRLGIAPVKIAALQHAAGVAALSTPADKLAFYRKLEAGPERKAFREKNWNDLIAAEAAEKSASKP